MNSGRLGERGISGLAASKGLVSTLDLLAQLIAESVTIYALSTRRVGTMSEYAGVDNA